MWYYMDNLASIHYRESKNYKVIINCNNVPVDEPIPEFPGPTLYYTKWTNRVISKHDYTRVNTSLMGSNS